jgi:transposase
VLEDTHTAWQPQRAQTLVLYAPGLNAADMAALLELHPPPIYAYRHAFDQQGLAWLHQPRRGGPPAAMTPAQQAEIWRLAEPPPDEVGRLYGRWALSKLRAHRIQQRWVKRLSREPLRRLLNKGGCASAMSGARSSVKPPGAAP